TSIRRIRSIPYGVLIVSTLSVLEIRRIHLWKGFWTKDAATGTHFQMKAAVLWTINDFPARSSLSGWSGQGYYACPTCNKDTLSMAVKNKIVYVGYRRFLRTQHPLRSKFKEFCGFPEQKPKLKKFTKMDI
ncbi:hypothetical protein Tco_0220311, partial [Tanacetum coccineum]